VVEGVTLRRCAACGVSLAWAWESPEAYARLYTEGERYHRDEQVRQGMRPHWERFAEHGRAAECRLAALAEFAPGPALLDVGAATGAFVAVARRRGFAAEGLEPNPEMARRARALGLPLRRGGWREAAGEWDVITLHDVIEHLPDAPACLRHLRARLRPGGLLVVETPEWRPERGAGWRHLRPREHVCLYSERALRRAVRAAGLQPAALRRPVPDKLALYARRAG